MPKLLSSLVFPDNTVQSTAATIGGLPADAVVVAGTRLYTNKLLAGDAQPAHRVFGDGKHEWGPGGSTAPDTNFYRYSAGLLGSDSGLVIKGTGYFGNYTTSWPLVIQSDGKLAFNNDTFLYRSGTNSLRSGGDFYTTGLINLDVGGTGAKLYFGAAADTNLYRGNAGQVWTDGVFVTKGSLYAGYPGANQFLLSTDGRLYFGSANDTALYRRSAANLQTDQTFWAAQFVSVGTMYFGSALDTSLYRNAANVLRTPGALYTDSWITCSGALYVGSAQDTYLTRQGAGLMQCNNSFQATGYLYAIGGHVYAGSYVYVGYASGGDTFFSRYAASTMQTNNSMYCLGYMQCVTTCYAAAFTVQSDRKLKTEIKPAKPSIDKLLSVKTYNYKHQGSDTQRLGLMADELPDEVVHHGEREGDEENQYVDMYALMTTLVATVQHLDQRLKAIEGA